jgi:hypothetical protein
VAHHAATVRTTASAAPATPSAAPSSRPTSAWHTHHASAKTASDTTIATPHRTFSRTSRTSPPRPTETLPGQEALPSKDSTLNMAIAMAPIRAGPCCLLPCSGHRWKGMGMASQPHDSTTADLARVPLTCVDFDAEPTVPLLRPCGAFDYLTLRSSSVVRHAPRRDLVFASAEELEGKQ